MLRPEDQPALVPAPTGPRSKNIRVRPLVRPEIDTKKLAMALVDMIKNMSSEERAKLEAEGQRILDKKKRAA
jgi:hypothetical protein